MYGSQLGIHEIMWKDTPPSLNVSLKILLEKTVKLQTVKFVGTRSQISKPYFLLSLPDTVCSLD